MNGIYLIRNRSSLDTNRYIAICAKDRVDAVRILIESCRLENVNYPDPDIQKIEDLNSGSHTIYRVYLNDSNHTELEFLVTG